MSKTFKAFIVVMSIIFFISFIPVGGFAEDSDVSAGAVVGDVLIMRPLGIVATALGAGFFIVSLPFALLGNNVGKAANATVVKPFKYTFVRPVGDGMGGD